MTQHNESHAEREYEKYIEEEIARGDLAFAPAFMQCYECDDSNGRNVPKRKVVKLGRVVNDADPTQTYVLSCGHIAI